MRTARFGVENRIKIQHLTHAQGAEWRGCSAEMLTDDMERNGELARRLKAA